MENKYELFLSNAVVINVRSENEFKQFIQLMRNLGLSKADYMKKIYDKYGFEKGFCYNAGIKYCNPEDVCFEYQLGKGFTFSSIKEYKKNDYFERVVKPHIERINQSIKKAIQANNATMLAYYQDEFETYIKRYSDVLGINLKYAFKNHWSVRLSKDILSSLKSLGQKVVENERFGAFTIASYQFISYVNALKDSNLITEKDKIEIAKFYVTTPLTILAEKAKETK